MKLAIIGSRGYGDYKNGVLLLNDKFDKALEAFQTHFLGANVTEIVSGGAKGADAIGKAIADHLGLKYTEFLPDWNKFGRSAGYKRNVQIVEYSDAVMAFWDGESRGTKHGIDLGQVQNKRVVVVRFSLDKK